MPYDNGRDEVLASEGVLVEQEIIPPVEDMLDDLVPARYPTPEPPSGKTSSYKCAWYKKPSVWWLLPLTVVCETFKAATVAPRTELYIKFACDELKPEYHVDASVVQWDPALWGTEMDVFEDVPVTFMQSNPVLDDQIMKPALLHPDKRCAQDPEVQRAAAKLTAAVASAEGILSCITLGWWAQYSDRAGRTKVLAITALTILFQDALLFLVAFKASILPGGYRTLFLGGVLHGLSGGFSAIVAAGHAYLADCTSPLARSRAFSFWAGSIYAGLAIGPSLGSLINAYSNDLLSTFYASGVTHIMYAILMIFVIPESVPDEARVKARELYEADMNIRPHTILGSLWRLTSFVRPLGVFIPRRLPTGQSGRQSRDWNLAFIGAAAAAVAVNVGSYPFKYQYAMKTFHWSSVQLGYWLSLVGIFRAFYLLVILPTIIKVLYAREERRSNSSGNEEKETHIKKIDLMIARASLLNDLVGYALVGMVTSQSPFIGATIVLAFGGGFVPSTQSLALALDSPSAHIARREARARRGILPSDAKQEIGRLFGALAFIQSLGTRVIGPVLFSTVFGATVGTYPKTLFWVCFFLVALAFGALGAVRLDIGILADPLEQTSLLV